MSEKELNPMLPIAMARQFGLTVNHEDAHKLVALLKSHFNQGVEVGLAQSTNATGTEAMVCADIARRQDFGLNKYGVSVADNPLSLREWLVHAYEETLDKAVYLRRAIAEIDKTMEGKQT